MENENKPKSAVEDFFANLPSEDQQVADVFAKEKAEGDKGDDSVKEEGEAKGEQKPKEPHKNRHHRRIEKALTEERELRIAAEARAKAFAEAGVTAAAEQVDPRLVQMYGPENLEAAKMHQSILNDLEAKAEERALTRLQEERAKEKKEVAEFESLVDDELSTLEEEHGIDLTSDSPAARKSRREFLEMVEKLSPKDAEGNISAYADFGEVWDVYQVKAQSAKPAPNRAKEIAARTMEAGESTKEAITPKRTPGFRGWMRDFNINP